jgi:hypothetical protein
VDRIATEFVGVKKRCAGDQASLKRVRRSGGVSVQPEAGDLSEHKLELTSVGVDRQLRSKFIQGVRQKRDRQKDRVYQDEYRKVVGLEMHHQSLQKTEIGLSSLMKANFTLGVPGQATTFMKTKVVEEYVHQVRSRDGASSEKRKRGDLFDEARASSRQRWEGSTSSTR